MIVVRLVQFWNIYAPNVVMLSGNAKLTKFVQPENAQSLIVVSVFGKLTEVKPVQPLKV